jgi:hypothetical protein
MELYQGISAVGGVVIVLIVGWVAWELWSGE